MSAVVLPGAPRLLEAAGLSLSRFKHQIPESVRDELCQESVLRMLTRSEVLDPLAFVRRVARHLAIDWLRRRYEVEMYDGIERMPGISWHEQVEEQIDLGRLRLALDAAPAPYREIVQALLFEGVELEELVQKELLDRGQEPSEQAWALARDAVYKRRSRALGWLRRKLSEAP